VFGYRPDCRNHLSSLFLKKFRVHETLIDVPSERAGQLSSSIARFDTSGANTRILAGATTETYIDHDSPGRSDAMPGGAGRSRRLRNADAKGVTMTAGYRYFRPRDEDPNDHAAVAAMQARSEAVKADQAFRQAMLAAIAAGQECAPTAVSAVAGTNAPKFIRGE
jgi:hypothetical protein